MYVRSLCHQYVICSLVSFFAVLSLLSGGNFAGESADTPRTTSQDPLALLNKVYFLVNHSGVAVQIEHAQITNKKLAKLSGFGLRGHIDAIENTWVSANKVLVKAAVDNLTFEVGDPAGTKLLQAKIPTDMPDGTKLFFEQQNDDYILRTKSSAIKQYKITLAIAEQKKLQPAQLTIPRMDVPEISLSITKNQ